MKTYTIVVGAPDLSIVSGTTAVTPAGGEIAISFHDDVEPKLSHVDISVALNSLMRDARANQTGA